MKIGSYKTSYLNADDVPTPRIITITDVMPVKFAGQEEKLVLYYEGSDQGVALNKTCLNQLEEIFGSDETDDWTGCKVVIFNDKSVMYQGKKVGGIRFRAPTTKEKDTISGAQPTA